MVALIVFAVTGFVLALVTLYVITVYNGLVQLKNNIERNWSNIDVLLKQRFDELPKLIKVCEGYMQHEQRTLEAQRTGPVTGAVAPRGTRFLSDLGLLVVSCEHGEMRQSPAGIYVYRDTGTAEVPLTETRSTGHPPGTWSASLHTRLLDHRLRRKRQFTVVTAHAKCNVLNIDFH